MPARPNILWIQTDEQRPDSLGCYGSTWAKTPNVDRLAASGITYTNAVCQSPVCVPSRASQLLCRYPQECNTLNNAVQECENIIPPGLLTFPEVFQQAGYVTASFGKSHTPAHPTWMQLERNVLDKAVAGYFELGEGYDEDSFHVIKRPGGTPVILAGTYPKRQGNPSEAITDRAIKFLQQRDSATPFLLRVSHNWPHTPVLPPAPFDHTYDPDEIPIRFHDEAAYRTRSGYDRNRADTQRIRDLSRDQIRQIWKHYMGLVAYVDFEIGRLLHALEAARLRENTIILVSADHGKLLGEWGATEKGVFDSEVWRVPFIWSWPGAIPAGEQRHELCEILDTGKSLLSLTGLDGQIPATYHGRNLFADPAPDAVFGQIGYPLLSAEVLTRPGVRQKPLKPGQAMRVGIRTQRYRMDLDWMRDGDRVPLSDADGNLFDLQADPQERQSLWHSPDQQPTIDLLSDRIQTWFDSLQHNPELFTAKECPCAATQSPV